MPLIRFIDSDCNFLLFNDQSEVYKTDFELERNARQEIAGQKEQILADLQLLQRRNQILLDRSADGAIAAAAIQEQYVPHCRKRNYRIYLIVD